MNLRCRPRSTAAFSPTPPAARRWFAIPARLRRRFAIPARSRRVIVLLAVALPFLTAVPRTARAWETASDSLLASCPDARTLRASLERLARASSATDPREASTALYWRGVSFAREGQGDSAIANLLRASALFTFDDEQLARADAWTARGRPADLDAAAALMQSVAPFPDVNEDRVPFRARLAWSLFVAKRPDSALAVFRPISRFLSHDLTWRERMGRAAAAATNQGRIATDVLMPVVIETRGMDQAALEALHRSLGPNQEKRVADLDSYLRQKIAEREAAERMGIEALGGHRVLFKASDGFPITGALYVPGPGSPVAVILMATADSLPLYDSLATRASQSGLAMLLIERRGSGAAVGPGMAVPGDAYGREEALEARIARDAAEALRAAARLAPFDTNRVVVGGVGDGAHTAIRAAGLVRGARALLILSPSNSMIQLGSSRARLAKLQRPTFIQLAMDEGYMYHSKDMYTDALYRSSDVKHSRVVEAHLMGGGPTVFRRDPSLWPRIEEWLHGALTVPHATRPPAPRKG